jgi:ariadne-1
MSSDASEFEYLEEDDLDDLDDLLDDMSGGELRVDEDDNELALSGVRKNYQVKYRVVTEEELSERIDEDAKRISGFIGCRPGHAKILLHQFRWHGDSLVERFTEDRDKTLEMAGVPADDNTLRISKGSADYMCILCCNDGRDLERAALSCGHYVCTNCYRYYISDKVNNGFAWDIMCPGDPKCPLVVDETGVRMMTDDSVFAKFQNLVIRSYVDDASSLVWCPAPGCAYAVECGVKRADLIRMVPTVQCNCKTVFCFGCGLSDHQPTLCVLAKKWLTKCKDDSETSHWIRANTKDCPKCRALIEKNGGCNHMSCRKCRFQFCWVCMGDWNQHQRDFYNCSRFDESKMVEKDISRRELERYLFYYERYDAHLQSLKLDNETYKKVEEKMHEMQETLKMNWIEVQFLADAFEVLRASRSTLMWSYAFAYYLKRNNYAYILEDNQKDLQDAVEALSEMFEKPVQEIARNRMQLMDKKTYVATRRMIVLEFMQTGYDDDLWEYNVDLY